MEWKCWEPASDYLLLDVSSSYRNAEQQSLHRQGLRLVPDLSFCTVKRVEAILPGKCQCPVAGREVSRSWLSKSVQVGLLEASGSPTTNH